MIKMVVFDMAGTTVNEDNVVYKTLQRAVNQAGYDATLDQVLRLGAGKEKLQAVKDILSEIKGSQEAGEEAMGIFEDFKLLLKEAYDHLDVQTFQGTTDLFEYLHKKEVKVVLNTGYDQYTATKLLSKLQWEKGREYDLLVTADDVEKGRPHPDMILHAMKELNMPNVESVIKIGDSIIDIEEGKSAGCKYTLGVTTGAHTREQLESAAPDFVVDSLNYIRELV